MLKDAEALRMALIRKLFKVRNEPKYKNLYINRLCVSMFTACIGYVFYGIFQIIPLHSLITNIGDDIHPTLYPLLVRYNGGLLHLLYFVYDLTRLQG